MVFLPWQHHIIEVSPGLVIIYFNRKGIFRLLLERKDSLAPISMQSKEEALPWPDLQAEIEGFFKGKGIRGDYPLIWEGYSSWTLRVLQLVQKIPHGQTLTYRQLAGKAGNPSAARAVGQALARNRTPILIPCHRVIGHDGKAVGFSAGLSWKKQLLDLEKCSAQV